jgi:chemotaxis protein MotA
MVACKIYVLIPLKQMTPDVERNLSVGIEIFRRAGTYASAFGWVGVLIGLAIISKNATPYNLEEFGPALSICILPALYGTVLHYLVFLPIRTKLSRIQADLVIQAS